MILNYQNQIQLLDDWCWAAVASSISFNYDPQSNYTQSNIAGDLLDNSCAAITVANSGSAPSVCRQDFSLIDALNHTQNNAWAVDKYLTFNEIVYQINSCWPVCCQIYWQAYDQSHFITIYGYDGTTIIIGDPEAGVCSIDYNSLITSYRSGLWIRSFGTQPTS